MSDTALLAIAALILVRALLSAASADIGADEHPGEVKARPTSFS